MRSILLSSIVCPYTYLSDESGIWNRNIATIDSVISHVDTIVHYRKFVTERKLTDYRRGVLEQDVHAAQGRMGQLMYIDGRYRFFVGRTETALQGQGVLPPSSGDAGDSSVTLPMATEGTGVIKVDPVVVPTVEKDRVNIHDYEFLDDNRGQPVVTSPDVVVIDPLDDQQAQQANGGSNAAGPDDFKFPEQRIYSLNFATDEVLTQVDNSFANLFYQNLNGAANLNPGLSAQTKLGISDLFEDYRIVGGIRWALDLNNNDYSLSYENLRDRMDKKVTVLVQNNRIFSDFSVFKTVTALARYELKWPFSEVASVRADLTYRYDRGVLQSTDLATLAAPNTNDHNVGVKVAYVFDNSLNKGLNLYNGWKFKVFGEYYQNPVEENSDISVVGFDIRHAQKVHRDIIWVNRLAGSASLGTRNILFFLGGVDNWLFPKFDGSIPIDFTQNYWFQTLATPMRGFFYNARNGNKFAVMNSELRIPIFKYLLNKPIKSDFIHNFQVVGFGDLGTAWTGSNPYSDDNSFNTITIPVNPLTISLRNKREPIVGGYGFGLRTRLLGYFVRADWAWGVDDGVRLPGEFYFSLSLDI